MAGAVGPLIGLGGSIFSAINAKKSRKPTDVSSADTSNTFGQLRNQSTTQFNQGMPMVQNAGGYFNTLLRGDRAAMSQATAGPAAQITDQYRGANSSLEHMGIRGGEAATSRAELARDQAAKVAGLTTGVQPMAAGALASLGMNQTEQGQRGVAAAGEGFGNLMRTRLASQDQSFKQNEGVASGFGKGISEILKPGVFHKGGGGVSPGTQVTPIDPNYGGETYP